MKTNILRNKCVWGDWIEYFNSLRLYNKSGGRRGLVQ